MNRKTFAHLSCASLTAILLAGCLPSDPAGETWLEPEAISQQIEELTAAEDPVPRQPPATSAGKAFELEPGGSINDPNQVDDVLDTDGPLRIERVTPAQGTVEGDTIVLVRGQGFVPGMAVLFGNVAASEVQVINETMLTARVPAQQAGDVDVVLEMNTENALHTVALPHSFQYLTPPPDDGTDTDGDGRTDVQELVGYQIEVDRFGFGLNPRHVIRFTVNSDPALTDTDGDGLDDAEEFFNKCDPHNRDTDDDGLWDGEEANRWQTSPVSMDSDGDARSPDPSTGSSTIAPNAVLFDGQELYSIEQLVLPPDQRGGLKPGATSPTLADTDGDGASDNDELGSPVRTPLVADLPELEIDIMDEMVIALNVEYAESIGVETGISTTLSQGSERTTESSTGTSSGSTFGSGFSGTSESTFGRSRTDSTSTTNSREYSWSIGSEVGFDGGLSGGVSSSYSETYGFSRTSGTDFTSDYSNSYGYTHEQSRETSEERTFEQGSSETGSTQQEYATFQNRTREQTEVTADGFVSLGIRARNAGNFAFSLTDLIVTLRQQTPAPAPGATSAFQTLATLSLSDALGDGITLGPGESSGVMQVSAQGLSASLVRGFLARPSNLMLETSTFDLTNEDDINFVFLTEQTFGQTALFLIDYGDGVVERHRVATNINRNPDGSLAGITVGQVLEDVLGMQPGIDYETTPNGQTGLAELTRITRGSQDFEFSGHPGGGFERAWVMFASRPESRGTLIDLEVPFQDIVLQNRDEFRLAFVEDLDHDRLNSREEYLFGSSDETMHSDASATRPQGDGLNDFFEANIGWMAGVRLADPNDPNSTVLSTLELPQRGSLAGYPRRVYSDPTTTDADVDGSDDREEFINGTDPSNPDTDGDGQLDGADPFPLTPAVRLFVKPSAAGGTAPTTAGEDDCIDAPAISGEGFFDADITVAATSEGDAGCPMLFDIWYCWTADRTGAVLVDTCGLFDPGVGVDVAVYDGCTCPADATNLLACESGTCGLHSQAQFNAVAGQSYLIRIGTNDFNTPGNPGQFEVRYVPADDCASAAQISKAGRYTFDTTLATQDGPTHASCGGQIDHDVWYCFTAPTSGDVTISTCNETSVDTKIAVYDGCVCPAADQDLLACDDNACGLQSEVSFNAVAGQSYMIRIGTAPGAAGGPGAFTVAYGAGSDAGTSWTKAFGTLQEALAEAALRNDASDPGYQPDRIVSEIWVAAGVYTPDAGLATPPADPRDATFTLVDNVSIYGGFSGTETHRSARNADPLSNGTVLSGDLNGDDSGLRTDVTSYHPSRADNAYSVVTVPDPVAGAVLDGVVIRGGNASDGTTFCYTPQCTGGGVYAEGDLTVRNTLFSANTSGGGGAGMAQHGNSIASLFNCVFVGNTAGANGGGFLVRGQKEAQLTACIFIDNTSGGEGGGLSATGYPISVSLALDDCTFERNASLYGGGVMMMGTFADIDGCSFRSNAALTDYAPLGGGGGMQISAGSHAVVVNTEFWKNRSDLSPGGAVHVRQAQAAFTNCTVFENSTLESTGGGIDVNGSTVQVANSIVWGNLPATESGQVASTSGLFVSNSNVEWLDQLSGFGNIGQDPLFIADGVNGNFRLHASSPCIDAGSNFVDIDPFEGGFQELPRFDLDGAPRKLDGRLDGNESVDMGAYEYQP